MARYITECLGKFFLVVVVLYAINYHSGWAIPTIIASVLILLIYLGAPYSKAHYNPAVSWCFFIRKEININQLIGYWTSQLIASALAWLVYKSFFSRTTTETWFFDQNINLQVWSVEFCATCCLVAVIMAVATLKQTEGNKYYGIAIGGIVGIMIVIAGPISSAVMNPSVLLGFSSTFFKVDILLFYLLAQIAAATTVGYAYNKLFGPVEATSK